MDVLIRSMELYDRQSRQEPPSKVRSKIKFRTKTQKPNISQEEIDMILRELCQSYDCQWKAIAAVLQRDHHITLAPVDIYVRYRNKLDPNIDCSQFTYDEQRKILQMFFLEGKTYKIIKLQKFKNRRSYMFRAIIQMHVKHALKNIESYLSEELQQLPQNQLIGQHDKYRRNLYKGIVCNTIIEWKYNKALYKMLYFFMIAKVADYNRIPKQLAMIMYKRLKELQIAVDSQHELKFKKIDPNYNKEEQEYLRYQRVTVNRYRYNESQDGQNLKEKKRKEKKKQRQREKEQSKQRKKKQRQKIRSSKRKTGLNKYQLNSIKNKKKGISNAEDEQYIPQDLGQTPERRYSNRWGKIYSESEDINLDQLDQLEILSDESLQNFDSSDQQIENMVMKGLHEIDLGKTVIQVYKLPQKYSKQ